MPVPLPQKRKRPKRTSTLTLWGRGKASSVNWKAGSEQTLNLLTPSLWTPQPPQLTQSNCNSTTRDPRRRGLLEPFQKVARTRRWPVTTVGSQELSKGRLSSLPSEEHFSTVSKVGVAGGSLKETTDERGSVSALPKQSSRPVSR